jgi:hypothetical protein
VAAGKMRVLQLEAAVRARDKEVASLGRQAESLRADLQEAAARCPGLACVCCYI